MSPANILKFFSGASRIPATGLDETPKIYFTDLDCLPNTSTCDLSITFPRRFGFLTYEEFEDKMDLCILGSPGYGKV